MKSEIFFEKKKKQSQESQTVQLLQLTAALNRTALSAWLLLQTPLCAALLQSPLCVALLSTLLLVELLQFPLCAALFSTVLLAAQLQSPLCAARPTTLLLAAQLHVLLQLAALLLLASPGQAGLFQGIFSRSSLVVPLSLSLSLTLPPQSSATMPARPPPCFSTANKEEGLKVMKF